MTSNLHQILQKDGKPRCPTIIFQLQNSMIWRASQKSHSRDGCDDEEVWSPTLPHIVQDSASNPSIPPKWNRYHPEQEYASSLCLN